MDTPGRRIAWALDEKGRSPNWLSGQLDVHRTTIDRWIKDERRPSWEQIGPLAAALGVSVAWLYSGHGEPTDADDAPGGGGPSRLPSGPRSTQSSESTERRRGARERRQGERG